MRINIDRLSKKHVAELVKRAVAGEEIIFEHNGEPVAKLIPFNPGNLKHPRQGGQWQVKVKMHPTSMSSQTLLWQRSVKLGAKWDVDGLPGSSVLRT